MPRQTSRSVIALHTRPVHIGFVPADAADDGALVQRLTDVVNRAYAQAEVGIWRNGYLRTRFDEIAGDTQRGWMAAADDSEGIAGSIKTYLLDEQTAWFGALAVDPTRAGRGVGGALVAFAEDNGIRNGAAEMQIEVLAPRGGHAHTDWLRAWYRRLGYQFVEYLDYATLDPAGVSYLALPIDVVVMRKRLTG